VEHLRQGGNGKTKEESEYLTQISSYGTAEQQDRSNDGHKVPYIQHRTVPTPNDSLSHKRLTSARLVSNKKKFACAIHFSTAAAPFCSLPPKAVN
jgi:hypothetical protein